MELIKFIQITNDVTIKRLELKLLNVTEHILFLSDYWLLTESEIRNNSMAFQWYHKIPQIFEDNRVIVEKKTQEYQNALRGWHSATILLFFFFIQIYFKKYVISKIIL